MTQALLKDGEINLRIWVQIKQGSRWVGYQGALVKFTVGSIKEAREVIANLKKSLED